MDSVREQYKNALRASKDVIDQAIDDMENSTNRTVCEGVYKWLVVTSRLLETMGIANTGEAPDIEEIEAMFDYIKVSIC